MNLQRVQPIATAQTGAGSGMPGPPTSPGGAGAPGGYERPLFRLNLLRALQLHRRLAIGIGLGGILLAVAYVLKAWPVYTAQSELYVQPIQSKVMAGPDQSFTSNVAAYDSFVQQQVQSASNPDVLISALHKLKPGSWQRAGETEQAAAARLGGTIEVARQGTSYEVAIAAKAKNPQLVADIANAVAASIVERASGEGNAGNEQRIAVLKEERERIKNELTSDYSEQDALNKQLGMAAVGTEAPDLIDADIGKTREELIKAQTDHDEAEARFAAMGAGKGESSSAIDAEAEDMVAADAGLTSMKTSLNSRRAVLITQMSNLTPSNPEYKQDAAELAKINGNLETMMKDLRGKAAARIQQKLRMDLERTAGVETRLNGQLRQLTGTAASATPKLQRASDLATNIARLRTRYTNVDEQLHNLILESSAPGAVHISAAAVPPLHPTVSGILKKALPLALGGLLFGLLAASIANHLDPKVYIGSDIEQVLGFAPMAVLPDFDEVSEEVSSEHLLRLSAAIEHARKQGDLNNGIFTGTSSGVGVTTVARRVCDVLAAMGRPTVLLDSSRTPPPAPRANKEGVADQPATQRGSRSTALLRRVAAESELEEESLVLTDTAPLLISAETEYLARFVDCAIVVAESGVTTRAQLLAAVNTLQRLDVGVMGFVLNRVKLATADPEFRRSVHEIENHHRAQSASAPRRADSRRAERTSPVAEDFMPEAKELPSESSVKGNPESAELGASGSGTRRSPAVVSQWSKAAPVKPWLPQTPRPAEKAATGTEADTPWWLSDGLSKTPTKPEGEQDSKPHVAVEAAPTPAQTHEPRLQTISLETWETPAVRPVVVPPPIKESLSASVEEQVQPLAERATSISASEFAATVEPAPVVVKKPAPPTVAETKSTDVDRAVSEFILEKPAPSTVEKAAAFVAERVSALRVEKVVPAAFEAPSHTAVADVVQPAAVKAVAEETVVQGAEEKPIESPSRMNALRGLLFSIGLKNLNKSREPLSIKDPGTPDFEPEPQREAVMPHLTPLAEPAPVATVPTIQRPVAESPAAVRREELPSIVVPPAAVTSMEIKPEKEPVKGVTAVPEILPPKEFVPIREGENVRATTSPSRSDRREAWDEVQILPSRRGQYKRR